MGEEDWKFSRIKELLGPLNFQIGSATRGQISQKALFQNFRGAFGAATNFRFWNDIIHQMWQYTTSIFEISKFSIFFTKMFDFQKFFWNLDLETLQKSLFYCIFAYLSCKNGKIIRTSVNIGWTSSPLPLLAITPFELPNLELGWGQFENHFMYAERIVLVF